MGHKCFISFKTEDEWYKKHIQDQLDIDMIDKSLDEVIDSDDPDYVMRKIREDYLSDSSVTIFLIGLRSSENLGLTEQEYIKRELQASLYNGDTGRNGILGVVLPQMYAHIYKNSYSCEECGGSHNCICVNNATVVSEFSYNYYIPHDKCAHSEEDRYCVLVKWEEFCSEPEKYIDQAFDKRTELIADKVKVYP